MIVPLGEWTPDIDSVTSQGLTVAENCVPSPEGYEQLRALEAVTGALSATCVGAAWFADSAGTTRVFAGDATKLYQLSSTTWTDESKGGGYTGASNWEFVQFGNRVIATDYANAVQYFDMPTVSTVFADLPGSPPRARRIAVVGDFVVLGDINDGADKPNWIAWSGFNASELWTPSLATQSDKQELFTGGAVQKIVGGAGSSAVVFQERAIKVLVYEGPPRIFRVDPVEESGTPAPNSVCVAGSKIAYYGWDGFAIFQLGAGSTVISDNKVTEWFQANCPDVTTLRGVADREAQRFIWAFSSGGSTNDRVIIYDWSIGRWSYGKVTSEILFEFSTPGYNLDNIDSLVPDIDAGAVSFDSRIWLGGSISVGGFDADHKAATFSGSPLTAVFETGELSGGDGRLFITKARPLVTGYGGVTMQVASRSTLAAQASFGGASALNSAGEFTFRANARWHRFRLTVTGGFTRAVGLDVSATAEGNR